MKKSLLILMSGFLISFSAIANEVELARIEKNLGAIQSINLVLIGEGSDSRYFVKTIKKDGTSSKTDITQFESTLRELLYGVNDSSDAIVVKTREFVCFNIPRPGPELVVVRTDRSGPTNTSQEYTVLTNVGCEFSKRLAPKSAEGETSAQILYRFLFDAANSKN